MKYLLILILITISCSPTEPPDYSEEDDTSECGGPPGYDCGDYIFLKQFIDANSQIFRHYLDVNENGILEPLEFGYQYWDNGRIINLDLSYNNNVIMKLDNPTELDLTNYRLTVIPDNIGDLDELQYLTLNYNEFDLIPESIGNLTKLKKLVVTGNIITSLPHSTGNLISLEVLAINNNELTSLPETIGGLQSIERLFLQNNNLESIPDRIGDLILLEWLLLNDNSLLSMPDNIANLESLLMLTLYNNELAFFPDTICKEDGEGNSFIINPNLTMFSVNNNILCEIPVCLQDMDIVSRPCEECRPTELYVKRQCADSVDYNILQNFIDLNHMAHYNLDFEGNFTFSSNDNDGDGYPDTLYTTFPNSAKDCVNPDWWDDGRLRKIIFRQQGLTSILPENIGQLDQLKVLQLTSNQLHGAIPASIVNLTNLIELRLDHNNFSGEIPDDIGALSNLTELRFNNNQLGGGIPQSITSLVSLKYLYLNDNYFIGGSIPDNIGNLSSLRVLHLDRNQLAGEIPVSIENLINLEQLHLQYNSLSGVIQESLCDLSLAHSLTHFYYHGNNFCPPYLESYCAPVMSGHSQICEEE